MKSLTFRRAAALCLALLMFAGGAQAAAPTRVARLGYLEGEVSFLEAGDSGNSGNSDWVQASLNRPLTTGDRLWTDRSAAVELQLEGAAVRMGERSNLTVLNLDARITQLQLSQGALRLRVRALAPGQSVEVDTPNLALVLRRPGDYRIDVDPQGDATQVWVPSGGAEAFGEGASYRIDSGQGYRFYGTGLSDYEALGDYQADELDRWAQARERRIDSSASVRYVPAGVVGYEDLDANGRWVVDASYGNVWLPSRVAAGWTPYRDGRWTWVEPWGWTWIDDAPWGYAVSHYGRWAYLGNAWGWVPGAARERVVYAPALVVFVGANQVRNAPERRHGFAGTSWFPLGPREDFRPGQAPARDGYANQRVRGAVVAATNQPPRERAPEAEARSRPPRDNRPVVAHTAPPAPVAPATPVAPAAPAANGAPPKSGLPAEPPARVRVITIPAAAAPVAPPPGPRGDAPRGERRPESARPTAPPAVPVTAPLAAPGVAPIAAPIAAPVRVEPARGEAVRNDALKNGTARNDGPRNGAARNEALQNEAARNEAAKRDAARAEEARGNAARTDASRNEAARNEQARQPGRNADAPRGNAQRPERDLTPEEELLLRQGRRKP